MVFRKSVVVVSAVALVMCATAAYCLPVTKVWGDEERNWIRYTVPLPKSISIPEKVLLAKSSVGIAPPAQKDMIVDQAITELTGLIGEAAQGRPPFTIVMQLGGEDAKPLEALKNSGQAYRILPTDGDSLRLVALKPAGLYYASKTLQQLIAARAKGDQLEMPLVTVTDWPDVEDRGLWGSDNHENIPWLADRKMNWMEQISNQFVDMKTGQAVAKVKDDREKLYLEGPQRAIKFVPVVLHLEQSSGKGPIAYYPHIKGKSEHHGVMCYSQPKTIEIITDWIVQLARLPHVEEVDVWMSENLGGKIGCQCSRCKATGVNPMVLEERAIVKAWRAAQKQLGRDIGLRILTSEATWDYLPQIISEYPKEVKIIFYHSLLSYTADKRPMIPDFMEQEAKNGRWIGTCPNFSAIVGYVQPFESAQFARYRAYELVHKNASGILGYATPLVRVCKYNVEAFAEYTWNVMGRSTREFATSWAVRNGIKDPDTFAEFREVIGPVAWRYNGGDWPMRATHWRMRPSIAERLRLGTLPGFRHYIDTFVKCPFGAYSGPEQLKKDVESSAKAVELAQQLGVEEYIQESKVAQGYVNALYALYELTKVVKDGKVAPQDKADAAKYFQMYADGFRQARDAVIKWNAVFFPGSPNPRKEDWPKPAVESDMLVKDMTALARRLGVEVH